MFYDTCRQPAKKKNKREIQTKHTKERLHLSPIIDDKAFLTTRKTTHMCTIMGKMTMLYRY